MTPLQTLQSLAEKSGWWEVFLTKRNPDLSPKFRGEFYATDITLQELRIMSELHQRLDPENLAAELASEFGFKYQDLVPVGFEIYGGMGCQAFWMKIAVRLHEVLNRP